MSSKKRALSDEDEPTSVKKRILSGENGSPRVNGVHNDDDPVVESAADLENFRKEAIYRKMRHYSRENDRYHAQILELEKRRTRCEAGLAAISACWTQILETIRLLTRPGDLPGSTDEIFSLTPYLEDIHDVDLKQTLDRSSRATQSLVAKFAQLSGDTYAKLLKDNTYRLNQTKRSETAALKAQLELLRDRLHDIEQQRDKLRDQLIVAENRYDRLKLTKAEVATQSPIAAAPAPVPKPLPPPPPLFFDLDNPGLTTEQKLEKRLRLKQDDLERLANDIVRAREEVASVRIEARNLPVDIVSHSPHYVILANTLSKAQHSINEYKEKCDALTRELDEQIAANSQDGSAPFQQEINDLKAILIKRDADLTRLRDLRDQQQAELNERKQKDISKMASVQEFKTLTESQAERISVLQSQLARCKLQLAAQTGNQDLFEFLLGSGADSSYVSKLQASLKAAESHIAALEQSLSGDPDIARQARREADLHQQLSIVAAELERYQRLCGDASGDLFVKLEQKEAELQKLRLLDQQREQTEASLYSEIDKISAAWEVLERQVKSKVFDLANLEDRLSRAGLDKAKSENKFYACMREKEAIEAERKALGRNSEKQAKAIEKLVENEKSLAAQMADLNKELTLLHRRNEDQVEAIKVANAVAEEWRLKADGEKARAAEAMQVMTEREKELSDIRTTLRRKEEEIVDLTEKYEEAQVMMAKEVRPQTTQESEVPPTNSKLQEDHDRLLLLMTCGICKKGFREVAITKCMHTFCKKCVDDRISNRQRKCPSCNLAFAQSEVQPLYFQ